MTIKSFNLVTTGRRDLIYSAKFSESLCFCKCLERVFVYFNQKKGYSQYTIFIGIT